MGQATAGGAGSCKGARAASCSGTARGGREARPSGSPVPTLGVPCAGPRGALSGPSGSTPRLSPAGIALIMWNALYTAEKAIIRWSLLAEACYFAVQFLGECPRAGRDKGGGGGGCVVRSGDRWWAGHWWSILPTSCLPFLSPME